MALLHWEGWRANHKRVERIRRPHLGELLKPPAFALGRGQPPGWDELVQVHGDHDAIQASPDGLPAIDIHAT